MSVAQGRRTYYTLDGLKAVAAVTIVMRHIPHFLGGWGFPCSFLAVDLFYILSGFVLAAAYEQRLQSGMMTLNFLWMRISRLYPLYILGTAVGVPVALLSMKYGGGGLAVPWTESMFLVSLPLSALMLPTPKFSPADFLYPFNTVLWCILFELVVNFIYVFFWKFLCKIETLIALVVVSAVGLTWYGLATGYVDSGYCWSTITGGFFRAMFSFFCGVLVYRLRSRKEKISTPLALGVIALIPLIFIFPENIYFELMVVLGFFPGMVALASMIEPMGFARKMFGAVGASSYAMYAMHKPLYQLLLGLLKITLPIEPEHLAPWIGIVFIMMLISACILINRWYDTPFRSILARPRR